MNRKIRIFLLCLVLLIVLIGTPLWQLHCQVLQQRKDQALIVAIKEMDDAQVLALLADGASGEARASAKPPTMREVLAHLLDRIRRPDKVSFDLPKDDNHLPALLLLYKTIYENHLYKYSTDPGPDPFVVHALLDHGAQVNDRDADGQSPLWFASSFSNVACVRLLLARGADTEAKDTELLTTPLMQADERVATVLLEHGANIESRDRYQETTLMHALVAGHYDIVRVLLKHGCKVSPKDTRGFTAFDHFRNNPYPGYQEIKALLLKQGEIERKNSPRGVQTE